MQDSAARDELKSARTPFMPLHLLNALAREGFEELTAISDRDSGLQAYLALHDTSAGPAFGGVRRFQYGDEQRALLDCLRLSRAMTTKCVLAGLPAGGAKVVILDHADLDLEQAYRALGRAVQRFAGRYYSGPDVGTGAEELGWMSEHTAYVTKPGPDGPGRLAEATSAGVFAGIATALRHLDDEVDWPNRRIVVQGLGAVGFELASRLVGVGAHVVGLDLDTERAAEARDALGIETLEPGSEFDAPCDVFSPNAMGGVVHDLALARLKTRVVAGGANNVLARTLHGDHLHDRDILFMPDHVINSGALIRGSLFHLTGRRTPIAEIEERIGKVAQRILRISRDEDRPTERVARREADRILERRRSLTDASLERVPSANAPTPVLDLPESHTT